MRLSRIVLLAALAAFPVFSLAQETVTEKTVFTFPEGQNYAAGASNVVQAADGNFYGTTAGLGQYEDPPGVGNCGNIFRVTPAGVYTDLHDFDATDGCLPNGLIQGGDGYLYGTAFVGNNTSCYGGYYCGTAFKISLSGAFTLLFTFNSTSGFGPRAGLTQGSDGNFHGTAGKGGSDASNCEGLYGCGTVFQFNSAGTLGATADFLADPSTGSGVGGYPGGTLVQASDGNYYGEASLFNYNEQEGMVLSSYATIFSVTSGSLADVYVSPNSNSSDPSQPSNPAGLESFGSLAEGPDGNLYGAGDDGENDSVFFRLSLAGGFTAVDTIPFGSNSELPALSYAAPFLASDGNFYSAGTGGTYGQGTVVQLPTGSPYSIIYNFRAVYDGENPGPSLLQGSDGNLYGTTYVGGYLDNFDEGGGTLYSLQFSPALPAPVQLTFTQPTITIGSSYTLNWQVLNAFSDTFQQCYEFSTSSGVTALGKLSGTLANGVYSGSVTGTPTLPGNYPLAITCGGQESGYATLTVSKASTTAALAVSPASLPVGGTVTLTTTIAKTAGLPTPAGSVTFYSGSTSLATVPVNKSGVATLSAPTTGYPPGTYQVKAVYSGDTYYKSATSAVKTVTLTGGSATTTSLSASPSTVTPPAQVTLTATVKRATGSGTPTGSVTFNASGETVGKATLNGSGVATLKSSTNGIPAGKYSVTAVYGGDGSDAGSTSDAVMVTVK